MEFDYALASSIQSESQFEDAEFPATQRSIGSGKSTVTMRIRDASGDVTAREVPVVFLRPDAMGRRDLGEQQWKLSRRTPSGADVAQGSEGDCWLLSAMSVVAEGTGHIAHALRSADADGCGAVQIRLCLGGLWTVVTVDDRVPCNSLTRRPVFAQGAEQQLWPCMIEKAIAKVTGSYRALSGGTVAEGLRLLTGASVSRLYLRTCETREAQALRRAASALTDACARSKARYASDSRVTVSLGSMMQRVCADAGRRGLPIGSEAEAASKAAGGEMPDLDLIWGRMVSWKHSGCLMGASCIVEDVEWEDQQRAAREMAASVGLQSEHAYSILELVSVGSDRLLRLRNPWGRGEYTGRFGSGWSGWTPALRERLGAYDMEGSGIFFIEFSDFLNYFSVVEVARLHSNWRTVRSAAMLADSARGASAEGGFPAWELVADTDSEVYVTVWQASQRLRGGGRMRGLAPEESLEAMILDGVVGHNGRPVAAEDVAAAPAAAAAAAAAAASSSSSSSSSAAASELGPALSRASSSAVLTEDGRVLTTDRRRPAPEPTELAVSIHAAGDVAKEAPGSHLGPHVGGGMRSSAECVNVDQRLSARRRYTVVPLAFAHMARGQWQEAVLSVHAPTSVRMRRVTISPRRYAEAILERVSALGVAVRMQGDSHSAGVVVRELSHDNCMIITAENRSSSFVFSVEYSLESVTGAVSSRGAFFTKDELPPRTAQVIQILSLDGSSGYGYRGGMVFSLRNVSAPEEALTAESHFPEVSGFHAAVPIED